MQAPANSAPGARIAVPAASVKQQGPPVSQACLPLGE